jgi:hypothetical protein
VLLAVARDEEEGKETIWRVYIINKQDVPLDTVMITSKGYGEKDGEQQKTSTLRHVIERLEANSYAIIEPLDKSVFHLNNEYWVSYYLNGQIYDKKFIFVPDSLNEENVQHIPELDLDGVLHS